MPFSDEGHSEGWGACGRVEPGGLRAHGGQSDHLAERASRLLAAFPNDKWLYGAEGSPKAPASGTCPWSRAPHCVYSPAIPAGV